MKDVQAIDIIISPFSNKLPTGKENPKNYPYWQELINLLKEHSIFTITQLGIRDEPKFKNIDEFWWDLSLKELENRIVLDNQFFISVDNFFPHLAHYKKQKGIVIWGHSDPKIFGYPENKNILSSRENLRTYQFQTWNEIDYKEAIFPNPQIIISIIVELLGDD